MPELPDLQVFKLNLQKKFAGKKLDKIKVVNKRKVNVSESALRSKLEGKKLKMIKREGKELHFVFEGDKVLGFHLMLRGELHIFKEKNEFKYPVIELLFKNKNGLALTDRRQMANIRFNPPQPDSPDAASGEFNYDYLEGGLKKYKSRKIKDLLIDQKFVRGIGNAYIDEILWSARIHPSSSAGKIPAEKTKKLFNTISKILKNAEKQILKKNPGIISGEIRDFLKIHNSKRKNSPAGYPIKKDKTGSRYTYYTDEQVLYR